MTNLKPCPFCGAKARMTEKRRGDNRRLGSYHQGLCGRCHARGPIVADDIAKAADAWNRRADASHAPDGTLTESPADVVLALREYASNPGYSHNDYADTMRQAAHCIESMRAMLWNCALAPSGGEATELRICTDALTDIAGRLGVETAVEIPTMASGVFDAIDSLLAARAR